MTSLVSIITPSYNSASFIKESINSVLSQTYENWEMIIVDDASKDNTTEIIEEYIKKDSRIKLIRLEKNSGPAIARNEAIKKAKGRYIAFLDSDDFWHKDKLTKQLAFMQDKDVALSYTGYYTVDEDTSNPMGLMEVVDSVDYHTLLKQNIIGCLSVIYDSEKLEKMYMPDISKRQDFALWLKILKKIPVACGLNEPLAYYRVRTASISSNKFKASLYNWKLYKDIEKLPLYKAIYYFAWYTYNSIFHKRNRR
jgi:glycosyltransferase involved in cell wall biosynthesis